MFRTSTRALGSCLGAGPNRPSEGRRGLAASCPVALPDITGDVPTQPRSLVNNREAQTYRLCLYNCVCLRGSDGARREAADLALLGQLRADLQAVLERRLVCMRQDCLCHMHAAMPACRMRVRRVPCTRPLCACWRHTVLASFGKSGCRLFHAARVLRCPSPCADFVWLRLVAPSSRTRAGVGASYFVMPPGQHYNRAAVHQCKWHTGCGKRFSSKRQLHRHLEQEHQLRRDGERGWRATGFGAKLRRQNERAVKPRTQQRPPEERGVIAMLNQTPYVPHVASRVTFGTDPSSCAANRQSSRGFATAERPPPADGSQPSSGIGRRAAIGATPAGATAARPPPSSAPAAMPPFGRLGAALGGSTSAERPPAVGGSFTAETPPWPMSAGMPPSSTCDEGVRAVSFGVSPGPVPRLQCRHLDRPPARPRGEVDDDLWVSSRWNQWTRDPGGDAANVRL